MPDTKKDEELDRLARAVPGWVGRKLLHVIGWILVWAGYAFGFGVGIFLLNHLPGWIPQSVYDWVRGLWTIVSIALSLAALVGNFLVSFYVGLIAAMPLVILGAYFADPDGDRGFGLLAVKPEWKSIRRRPPLRLLSRTGRARINREHQEALMDYHMAQDEWDAAIARIATYEVQGRTFSSLEEAEEAATSLSNPIVGRDSAGGIVREFRYGEGRP